MRVALDTERTNFLWFTGGYSPWRGQAVVTADRIDAAQSGPLADGTTNWIQTTVPGPAAVSFWWKISSETNRYFLRFLIDGVEVTNISGEVDWQRRVLPITTMSAVVRWEFSKDASGSAGKDRAWVDAIEVGALSPVITNAAPDTNIVEQGTTVKMKVDSAGTPPFAFH